MSLRNCFSFSKGINLRDMLWHSGSKNETHTPKMVCVGKIRPRDVHMGSLLLLFFEKAKLVHLSNVRKVLFLRS